MSDGIKTGLMGGSYNPVHIGHLRAAEVVRELLSLEKVVFIPASVNPLKEGEPTCDAEHRLRMLELATEDNPFFEISDTEIKRGGNSYTIDTLRYFSEKYPKDSHYFIMGSELFTDISTWKDYRELFNYSNFIVVRRPGFSSEDSSGLIPLELSQDFRYLKEHSKNEEITLYEHRSSHLVYFVTIQGFELSSTMIRELVEKGSSIKYLVPGKLEEYILSKGIYRRK